MRPWQVFAGRTDLVLLAMLARPNYLQTLLLSLELLRLISRKTAPELHEALGKAGFKRDLCTIQRLLEVLSEHFEIEPDDRSHPWGYRWAERAKGLSVPTLNEQESLLLRCSKFLEEEII